MERLTKRNEADAAYYYPNCFNECDGFGYSSKCDKCGFQDKVCKKLGEYEDLEEQGLLLRLPCKVGDTVYHFCKEFGQILKYDVDFINIADGVITISCSSYSQGIDDTGECLDEIEADITDFDFNTSTPYSFVSRTKSEVEQKLKETEGK